MAARSTNPDPSTLAASIQVEEVDRSQTEVNVVGVLEPSATLMTQEGDPQPPSPRPSAKRPGGFPPKPAPVVNTGPPQAKRELDRMLPSGLRVQVYKRGNAGKLSYIEEYSPSDVSGAGSIEVFIKRHVVPEYGYGEFHLYRHDGKNDPQAMGSVTVEAPLSKGMNGGGQPIESVRELHKLAEEIAAKNQQPVAPQKTPLEEMAAMMTTMQQMGIIPKDGNGQQNPMAMMFMQQQMQMQMQMQQRSTGPDPMMLKVLEKMERMEEEHRIQIQSLSMTSQPMMPMAPPHDPMAQMMPMIQMMQEQNRLMVEAIRSSKPDRDPVKDLADLRLLLGKEEPAMGPRDMLAMIPQLREAINPSGNSDPFEKTIQNFRLFKLMQKEFGGDERSAPHSEGPPEDNFWTFAKGLFQSQVGQQIAAQMAAQIAGQGQQQTQGAHQNQRQLVAQNVSARRAQQAQAQRAQQQGQPQARPQAPPPPATPPPQQPPEEENQEITIPDGFLQVHAPAINQAATPPERVQAIIQSFQLLGTSADFRPVVAKMFGLCKVNRKMEALAHLREILEFFSENEILEKNVPDLSVADFDKFWAIIRANLKFPEIPEVYPEGYTPPAPAQEVAPVNGIPAQNGSAAAPQPVPVAS